LKYFSLFSGIGGFELGFPKNWECVGYSEINKSAIAIYNNHFKEIKNYGDAKEINPKEIDDIDLLCSGFPCQAFSYAGERLGFKDTRGTLFFEIARIVKEKQPQYLLLENVKGLLSNDNRRTFASILATLDELGYNVEWEVLNSRYFGVPQNRERVFLIGHLRGTSGRQIFPIGRIGSKNEGEIGKEVSYAIDKSYYKGPWSKKPTEGRRQLVMVYADHTQANIKQRVRSLDNPSWCLGGTTTLIGIDGRLRKLTPIECERLQGFPDNWTKFGLENDSQIEISDTERYKCLGNAVTVNVVQEIANRMDQLL
jgi:DNA (cytosine-5)-methyltransferase 1